MNLKISLCLAGLLAFGLSYLPMLPSVAQSVSKSGERAERLANKLNLTEDQKAQMKQIKESTRTRIEAILTAEQKAQLQTAKQQGQRKREAFKSINLTEAQKEQIRGIRQETQQQMEAVLTPEQRQTLAQMRQERQQRR
jgi:periplasmic protein CpxP/Spy